MLQIPVKGEGKAEVLQRIRDLQEGDVSWKEGRTWSMVYYIDEDHLQLIKEAYGAYLSENFLNPFAFKGLRKMEEELIRMGVSLLNGDQNSTGTMTSGGTESIFLAVYAYRQRARALRPRIKAPEMVAPASIHPAFDKACHLLGIKLRKAPLAQDFRADPRQMERLVNANTILLAASSPSYPHGLLDPIESIADIALRRGLPMHVDACIGGFMLPWVERLGAALPPWDFRVNGVTSMSADLHKFGYAAKGASLILYREPDYLKHQFYVATDWPGGIYASTTMLGTRPGGAVSAAWAAMMALGQEGYLRVAGEIMEGVQRLKTALADMEDLEVIGDPVMNILAFTTRSNQPDIFVVADQLEARGWVVDRQQSPNCLHLTLMRYNIPVLDQYVADLKVALDFARNNPRAVSQGNAAMYGLMARIPFRGVVEKNVRRLFEELYNFSSSVLVNDHPHASTQDHSSLNPAPWIGKLNRFLTRWLAFKTWLKGRKIKG